MLLSGRRIRDAVRVSAALACVSGCALLGAGSQVARVEDLRIVQGTISGSEGDPVVAVAIQHPGGRIEDFFQLEGDGRYMLLVTPGRKQLVAFRDRNGDRVRQPDEPATWLHAEATIETGERIRNLGFDGVLPGEGAPSIDVAIDLVDGDLDDHHGLGGPPPGTLVGISDDRFSRDNANRGMWRPADFLVEPGGGVFFLEPYDPERTPVVFVHGMGGTPQDFAFLIEQLDRTRFQPWVLHYPSALRLEKVANYLRLTVDDLRARLDFERILFVAHSMGGLVSRATVNDMVELDAEEMVPLLVTISTPWSGHAAAASGVERSPVVLPSWRDMKPGSAFLEQMHETALPEAVEFHLMFGFEGHRSRRGTGGANDGSVAIASQLAPPAQRVAQRVYGFPADHTGILRRQDVADALNQLLIRASE